MFFFCFFFLLLSLLLLHASSSWDRLPFWAGEVGCLFFGRRGRLSFWQEVGCLFGRIFFRVVVILRACVRVAVAEFLCSDTDLTKDESPHTGYTFTPWVVSFTPPSIEHQVGGTSILRLFRRKAKKKRTTKFTNLLNKMSQFVSNNYHPPNILNLRGHALCNSLCGKKVCV